MKTLSPEAPQAAPPDGLRPQHLISDSAERGGREGAIVRALRLHSSCMRGNTPGSRSPAFFELL